MEKGRLTTSHLVLHLLHHQFWITKMKTLIRLFLLFALAGCDDLQPAAPATQAQRSAVTQKGLNAKSGGFEGAKALPLDYENRLSQHATLQGP